MPCPRCQRENRPQAEAGGLMAYSPDEEEIFRRAGSLAARILKGAKPADLPVEALVNAIHRAAPGAAIAFNTHPEDTGAAAARWI
jgi:hypothetical protein